MNYCWYVTYHIKIEYTSYQFGTFDLDIDDCQPNSCMNNGVCVDGVDSFTCDCAHGFAGDNCSIGKS